MRLLFTGILVVALLLIVYILITQKLGFAWLTRLGMHIVLAALAIYIVNFSGIVPQLYVPLNPITLTTVLLLGLPGVALLIGINLTFV
ncbi:pro-sigmaK processing inhibitor BofA family protein [Paenibacillus sp. YPG26]|uniref:pro-sigmaK processing inhibitor BofA family protein n=1 Tax=Paenibacillus sp. YPG26 TaxID=2878915 RepID=UPI002040C7F8|nr:pro-sigmaK processing inhibitor BofA family protein [Paenibacillus sp. YPG26]USB33435.1 pro-sigmaK processing inhibitor BofA family protein [Paenibacillus sp. YPG26]